MEQQPIALKGEMAMQTILHLHTSDIEEILQALKAKRDEAPQLFVNSPIVVDCKEIVIQSLNLDYVSLLSGLRELDFVPVGIRHVDSEAVEKLRLAGWALLRDSNAKKVELERKEKEAERAKEQEDSTEALAAEEPVPADTSEPVVATAATHAVNHTTVIDHPVRSGQQIHSPEGDIVVLSHTSVGSEVLAAGSVHIYGKLSGRVLAGINGDRTARIFCQALEPELISIAGQYQLFDDAETSLTGQPAMISLDGDSLKIEPIV